MARGSIRHRTTQALFLVGAVTAALVGAVTTRTLTRELRGQVEVANQGRAEAVAAHVRAQILQGRELLEAVASDPEVQTMDPGALERVLGLAVRFNHVFHSIYAYDLAGQVVLRRYRRGSATDEGRARSLDEKGDAPFVRVARATMQDGASRFLKVRRSSWGTLFIPCLVAAQAPGQPIRGVLSGAISAAGSGFQEMIQGLAPGAGGYVVLLGERGEVLARTRRAPGEVGEVFPAEVRRAGAASRVVRAGGLDLAGRAGIPEFGVEVLVALPQDEALDALPRALLDVVLAALGALVVAGLLGGVLAVRLTGPLERLLAGIREVGRGVLTHRVGIEGDDEMAEVGAAFDRLTESLARNRMIEEFWSDPDLEDEVD